MVLSVFSISKTVNMLKISEIIMKIIAVKEWLKVYETCIFFKLCTDFDVFE